MQNFTSLLVLRVVVIVVASFCGSVLRLDAQCDPPYLLPEGTCQEAPFTCLEDACYSTQPNPPDDPHNGWCGANTAIHNPQYFLFQATSTTVTIIINVTACEGGGCGLQSAILDACPWDNSNVVSCNPGTGVGGSMVLESTTMEVDSFYWLVIDGCAGQLCDYLIDVTDGIYSPGISGDLSGAYTEDEVVCQGQDNWTAIAEPELPEAAGYLWSGFPWGDGTHTSTFHDMSGPDDPLMIPDNAPVGGPYEICVVAFSGCDTTENPVCFDIWIESVDDGISPDVILCPEEYEVGVVWEGLTIPGPGTYTIEFNTPEGCPYDSIKTYDEFPAPDEGAVDTVVCEPFFIYEGTEYNSAGSFDLFYDNGSIYGCDSTAVLNLDLIYLEVESDFLCEYTQFTLTSQVILAVPTQSGISYEWYLDGILVSEDASFNTFDPGCYELFVSYEINGVECTFPAITNPMCIILEDLVPPAPVFDQISNTACELDFPIYSVIEEPDIIEWVWTGPNGVSIFGNGEHEVEVSWQGSSGGMMCVHAVNHCGAGPDTCFEVEVIPSPIPDFTMPTETCVDSAVTIEYTGSASMNATFLWNFGGGAQILSGGTGPGPHEVAWSSPGFRTVTVQVIEAGCDTADISYDIFVELLGQPLVNCTSDLNSITFTWSNVIGASGYSVNVLQGPSGVLQDTAYLVTGLAPGTVVEIEVVAMGVGACTETSSTLECIAQSCPPKDLEIILPSDSICLGDVSGPITLSATVDGVVSTGTWSGPGVDPAGTFNPLDPGVGAGVHQIIFNYDEGTCGYSEQATVYVFDSPTADFTLDNAICQDGDASVIYAGNASLTANFSWDFGLGAIVVSGSGAGPYALHWNNPGTYAISLTVAENNCNSQVFTQSVEVQPALSQPTINCFPTTSSVTFQWDSIPNGMDYTVTQLFGQTGTVNGDRFIVNGLVPGDSVSIELTVSSGGVCPPVVVQASCVAKNCPSPTFAITPVDDICLYPGTNTVDLEVTITNGNNGTGFWSGPGIVDATEGIFDPLMSGAGSHTLQFNYTEEGCSFVEPVTVDVYDPPVADISNTSFILTCDNDNQLDLDGSNSSAPGVISYLWTTTDGVILTPADQAVITAGAPGTYQLLVTDLTSMCEDAVSVTLTQDAGVPEADAGPDGLLNCNINFVVLGGASSQGPSIEYLWTTEGGIIGSDPTAATVTVTAGGTYELVVTDVSNGCKSIDEALVTVDSLYPTAVLAVGDILDCDTETTPVSATITPAGGTYNYLWTTASGVIQSGNGTAEIVAARPGIYTLILINQINGCSDTVDIEVLGDDDIISAIETAVDEPDCVGDVNGQIDIQSVTGGNEPFTYAWSNQATGPMLQNLGPGSYTVTITDANGCRFIETFTLPAPVAMNPDIGPNLRYNITELVTISLSVTDSAAIADVTWGGVAPSCPGCFNIEFPAAESGQVHVTVVDTNGCIDSASLTLTVYRPKHIFVPSVFSPNGDGTNDLFTVSGNTLVEVKALRIFDRWGGLLYEQLNIPGNAKQGWDGTRNGKQLSPGVYVFMAELLHDDGLEEVIKGDVTLVR